MKYSLQILKKQKFFQETQISSSKCIEHQIFLDAQLQLLGVWGYHWNILSCETQACKFIKKEPPAQVFFCEFYEISKNNFFTEHLWATASGRRSFT